MELGQNIRKQRKEQHISLKVLASEIGVSTSFLSQIENGKNEPSLSTLKKIAEALNVTISQLLGEEISASTEQLVKKNERVILSNVGEGGLKVEFLAALNSSNVMEACIHVIEPNSRSGSLNYSHEGQELFFVLEGKIQLVIDNKQYTMEEGDSYYLSDCYQPHMIVNQSATTQAKMLCITTPPYFYKCRRT